MSDHATGKITFLVLIVFCVCVTKSHASYNTLQDAELIATTDEYLIHVVRFRGQVSEYAEIPRQPGFEGLMILQTSRISGRMKTLFSTSVRAIASRPKTYVFTRLIGLELKGHQMAAVLFTSNPMQKPPDRQTRPLLGSGTCQIKFIDLVNDFGWEYKFRGIREFLEKPLPHETVEHGVITPLDHGVKVFGKTFDFRPVKTTEALDAEPDPLTLNGKIENLKLQLHAEKQTGAALQRKVDRLNSGLKEQQWLNTENEAELHQVNFEIQLLTDKMTAIRMEIWRIAAPVWIESPLDSGMDDLLLSVPYEQVAHLVQEWDRVDRLRFYMWRLKQIGYTPEICVPLLEYTLAEMVKAAQSSYWPVRLPDSYERGSQVELCASIEGRVANDVVRFSINKTVGRMTIQVTSKRLYCFESSIRKKRPAFALCQGSFSFAGELGRMYQSANYRANLKVPEGMELTQLELSRQNDTHWYGDGYGTPAWAAQYILPEFVEHFSPTDPNHEGERNPRVKPLDDE